MIDRPPAAQDPVPPEAAWQAGLLSASAGIAGGVVLVAALAGAFAEPGIEAQRLLRGWLIGLALALEIGVWLSARRGRLTLSARLQLIGGWAALGFGLSVFGGIGGIGGLGPGAYLLLAALASLLWSAPASLAFAGLCGLTPLAMAWAEAGLAGYPILPRPPVGPVPGSGLWLQVLPLALLTGTLPLALGRLRRLLVAQQDALRDQAHRRERLEAELAARDRELTRTRSRLREEIDDRTVALAALQASAGGLDHARRRLDAILAYLPRLVLYETRGGASAIVGNVEGLLGYPADSFDGGRTGFIDLLHPEDAAAQREGFAAWEAAGRQGVLGQEYRCRRADGSYIWLQDYTVEARAEDGSPYLAGALIDVSERRRAEAERERFTRQLRTAAETAERLGAILDPERLMRETVELMQARFELYHVHVYLFDREQQQLRVRAGTGEAGRRMVEAGHAIPLAAERSLVARAARLERVVLVDDVAGDPHHLPNPLLPATRSEVALPLRASGAIIGVLDVQDDQPGRFGPSDLDTFGTLAGQIGVAIENARLFAEMQSVMERLREVDRLKSEFLANMSHELRTPLNSIIGYAELMLMGINGEIDLESRKDLQAIFDNGQQLLELINDLLDLAKIEAGRMRLDAEDVMVGTLLEEVRRRNAGLLLKKPIQMTIEVAPGLPLLRVDRLRIEQVLNNLVSNAVKFTESGQIWLRAYPDGEAICLEVEDTGIGIEAAGLDSVFEKFRQADGSFTRRAKGTGLGLAITRHLVEMHGGTIEVQSRVDAGTIFTVRLPIQPSEPGKPLRAMFGLTPKEVEA
ncbi:MAG: GAF domain-containing protein [Caldilineae bacterium]|nr:GAF domain-containing protein [Chloroflexota bacterium]MCB9177272.1 GAF domain-containing protein [Caldilineae bacterium]